MPILHKTSNYINFNKIFCQWEFTGPIDSIWLPVFLYNPKWPIDMNTIHQHFYSYYMCIFKCRAGAIFHSASRIDCGWNMCSAGFCWFACIGISVCIDVRYTTHFNSLWGLRGEREGEDNELELLTACIRINWRFCFANCMQNSSHQLSTYQTYAQWYTTYHHNASYVILSDSSFYVFGKRLKFNLNQIKPRGEKNVLWTKKIPSLKRSEKDEINSYNFKCISWPKNTCPSDKVCSN